MKCIPAGLAGRVSPIYIGVSALIALCAAGVWYFARDHAAGHAGLKDLPKGSLIAVQPLAGYEPKLSAEENQILRTGPNGDDKASVRRYLLAKAKLEESPLIRMQLEQEAIVLTEGYGTTPAVVQDNAQVRSVTEALLTGKHPERLNPLIAPAPFDAAAYKSSPQTYLDTAEPGRVFQMKAAAAGVPRIEPVSPFMQDVRQGGAIDLIVKAAPGYPVTFTSMDCGAFGNGLTTQTVEADSAGVARVRFLGMPGTVLETNILASSPMSSGQVRFKTNTLVYADGAPVVSK